MTAFDAAAGRNDLNRLGHDRESPDRQPRLGHTAGGLVSKRIITGYGFWIFLLSDIIMFSAFFAAGRRHGRGTDRTGAVQPAQRRARDGVPSRLELHLRPRKHRCPGA